jgi:prepilin-type N-terminal cleavage/methylation domain-containing protein
MKLKRRAFTLIELLVVIAIIAILAAILFPVFAQAKKSAKITSSLSGLKQMALGLHMYSTDYDDMTVPEYGYPDGADPDQYHYNNTWAGRTLPYVKNMPIYFDKAYPEINNFNTTYQDPYYPTPWYTYTWAWITTFSINTNGYSRTTTGTNMCTGVNSGASSAPRSMSGLETVAERLAVTPTRYGTIPNWSWTRFLIPEASQPIADRYANTFSWNALVFDARKQYENRFIGAYADGHAAKFGPEKFVKRYADNPARNEYNGSNASYCAAMDARNLWNFWGRAWDGT